MKSWMCCTALLSFALTGCVTTNENGVTEIFGGLIHVKEPTQREVKEREGWISAQQSVISSNHPQVSEKIEFRSPLDVDTTFNLIRRDFRFIPPSQAGEYYQLQDIYKFDTNPGVSYLLGDTIKHTYHGKPIKAIVEIGISKYKNGSIVELQVTNSYDSDADGLAEDLKKRILRLVK